MHAGSGTIRGEGVIHVANGMAVCNFHHAAVDMSMIDISSDYSISVKPAIRDEVFGQMLKHRLKGIEGKHIVVPAKSLLRLDSELRERNIRVG